MVANDIIPHNKPLIPLAICDLPPNVSIIADAETDPIVGIQLKNDPIAFTNPYNWVGLHMKQSNMRQAMDGRGTKEMIITIASSSWFISIL
jgi:hypothetical protein